MIRFIAGFVSGLAVALAAAILAAWLLWNQYGHEIYWEWTVFEMPPACQEYEDPFANGEQDFYAQIEGEPTEEFWLLAIDRIKQYEIFDTSSAPSYSIKQGKIFVSLREFHKFSGYFGDTKTFADPDETFFRLSHYAARRIYQDRVAKGLIDEQTLEPFHIMQRIRQYKRPPHPDECGFMEELILKGGRFASE